MKTDHRVSDAGSRDTNDHDAGNHDAGSDDVGSDAVEQFAREHPQLVKFGRVGWVAKGVVYILTGVLAVAVALRPTESAQDSEASQTGAVAAIAERPAGTVLLLIAAAGLVLYSLWRLVTILLPADNDVASWLTRVGYGVSMITYLALAWTSVSLAMRSGGDNSEDSKVERATRSLMDLSLGRIVVGAVGLVLIVVSGVFLSKAIRGSFRSDLTGGGAGPLSTAHLMLLGRVGWVGRAVMMALIGFFITRAAVTFDPDDAQGLDGSLRKAADSGVGTWLVLVVGAGLMAYGVFCVLSAPRQRLAPVDA